MQTGNVELRLVVDSKGAITGINTLGAAAKTQGAKTEQAFRGVEQQSKRTKEALEGLGKGFLGVGKSSGVLGDVFKGALGANLAVAGLQGAASAARGFVTDAFDAAKQANAVAQALKFATGSAAAGKEEFAFIREEARRLGFDLQTSAKGFSSLAAAARGTTLEGKGVRDIFQSVSEAGVTLRLTAEQQAGALNAIQQMMSKGTVQAEELRGQLGERLPGAFQLAAKAMGVTTAQLGKMLEQGEVFSDEFLPKFAKALHEDFGKPAVEASNSSEAAITKFGNKVKEEGAAIGAIFLDLAGKAAKLALAVSDINGDTSKARGDLHIQGLDWSVRGPIEAANAAREKGLALAKEAKALEDQKGRGPNNSQQSVIDKLKEEGAKAAKADAKLAVQEAKAAMDRDVDVQNAVLESQRMARQKLRETSQTATSPTAKAGIADDEARTALKYAELEGQAARAAEELKIAAMVEGHEKKMSLIGAHEQDELAAFKLSAQAKYMTAEAREASITAIQEKYTKERIALSLAENQAIAAAGIDLVGSVGQALQAASGKNRTMAKAGMRLTQAAAIASTAAGVMKAFEQGGVLGFLTGAAIGVEGAAQVAIIEQQISKFAGGGIVPGTSTSGDKVPAMVNSGEMILNRNQQAQLFAQANGRGGGGGSRVLAPQINITIAGNASRETAESVADAVEARLQALVDDFQEADYRGMFRQPVRT